MKSPHKVCLVGSGNWGSAIAKIIGHNVRRHSDTFDASEIRMWTYEELINGEKITDIINKTHENVKYLPGIQLPDNIKAVPNLLDAVAGANTFVFVVPHQFVRGVCEQMRDVIPKENVRAISLIKGLDVSNGMDLISETIRDTLGEDKVDVSVLMGANIANEVASGQFCETTIGYRDSTSGELFKKLFHTPTFRVATVPDIYGVELCGALKNIVAIAAGFVDGLGFGDNTKSAIMRIGLMEMKKFSQMFYPGVREETFFESCGIADVITTCIGGRNRKVAESFVKTGKSFDELEKTMLNGQKLQGTLTAKEVYTVLASKGLTHEFPFFTTTYRICYENLSPTRIVQDI